MRKSGKIITILFFIFLLFSSGISLAAGYVSVSGGVSISTFPVVRGQNFSISFTLKEVIGQSKTFENVAIAILRSDNSHLFDFAMYSNVTVAAYGTWGKTATNYFYSSTPVGTYKAIVRGKVNGQWFDFDTTGSGVNPKSFQVIAPDSTKPVVNSFAVSPSSVTQGGSFQISYTVSDSGGSGLKQVELWRANDNGGSPGTWAQLQTKSASGNGPVSSSFNNAPSSTGIFWYGLHVVDNANNWSSEPSPKKVTVVAPDSTKPVVNSFAVSPASVTQGGSFQISYTVSDSGGSGLKQVELWRANDNGGSPGTWAQLQTKSASGNGPVSSSFNNAPSSTGIFWYGLHVVDNANNWSSEPSPKKVTVVAPDSTKPVVNSFAVSPASVTQGGSFQISYTVSDSGGSGLKQVELWRANDNGGSPGTWAQLQTKSASGNGPVSSSFSNAPSSTGIFWYGLHVVDNANNWSSEPSPKKVTVVAPDSTKPVVNSFAVSPASVTQGGSFQISYTVSDSGGSGLKQVELWRANDNGGSPGTWAQLQTKSASGNGPVSSSFNNAPSSTGIFWYGLHVVDNANNWSSEPSPKKVTVVAPDSTKPVVNSFAVSPASVTQGGSFQISYTVSDSGGSGLKQVELWRANDNGGSPGTWAQLQTKSASGNGPVSSSFNNAPSSTGIFWYGLHVVDNANNWSSEPSPKKVTLSADPPGDYGLPSPVIDFLLKKVTATWPLEKPYTRVTSRHCVINAYGSHIGIDILKSPSGYIPPNTIVRALCDGIVVHDSTVNVDVWNSFLIVKHDCGNDNNDIFGYYGHIRKKSGLTSFKRGETIGYVKNDGINSHLHLSVSKGNDWDRQKWGYDTCSQATADGYIDPENFFLFTY